MKVEDFRNILNAAWLETNLNRKNAYSNETRKNIAILHAMFYTECESWEEVEIKIKKPF